MRWILFVAASVSALATSASAQFVTLDRPAASGSLLGVDLGIVSISEIESVNFLRADFFGQVTYGGFGGYLTLPVSFASGGPGDDETALGNFEFGFLADFDLGAMGLAVHFGIVVPTAANDSLGEMFTNGLAVWARHTDFVSTLPDAVALRLAVNPRLRVALFVARADLGLDFAFNTSSDETLTFFRGNIGVGVDFGLGALVAELINFGSVGEHAPNDLSDAFTHSLGFSAVLDLSFLRAHLGVAFPLDEYNRGEIFSVLLGVQATFGDLAK